MAKEKLSYSQIADPNLLEPLIKELNQVNALLDVTAKALKKVATEGQNVAENTPFDNVENIEKVVKAIEKTKKATSDLDKIEQERKRLTEQQARLNDERVKQNFKLREQIKARTKLLRDEAKATVEQENAYKKLSRQVNKAQAEFKKLAAEQGLNSEAAQEAQKKFDLLNEQLREIDKAAKDGRRNVGRYRESLEGLQLGAFNVGEAVDGLGKTFKAFAANPIVFLVSALVAGLIALSKAFKASEAGSRLLRKGAAFLEGLFAVLTELVNDAVNAIIAFTEDPVQGLKDLGQVIIDNVITRFKALINILKLGGKAVKQLAKGDFEGLKETVKEVGKEYADLVTGVEDSVDKIKKGADAVGEYTTAFTKLQEAQEAVKRSNRALELQIAKSAESLELLTAAAEDDGRSLVEQREAIRAAGVEREKQAALQVKIAQQNLSILNQEVALRRKAGQDIRELLDERAQAEIALLDTQREASLARFENGARERLIILDIFDQELDDLIDFADNLKTIREQIAADENRNINDRKAALQQAESDLDQSFKAQVKLFEDTFNELRESRGEVGDFALPIEQLLGLDNAVELNTAINDLVTLSGAPAKVVERQRIRLLELLRERRTVENDLKIASEELTRSELDQLAVERDIFRQEQALQKLKVEGANADKIFAQLEKDRLEDQKELLRLQIEEAEEGSKTRVDLQKQLNDLLLKEQQDAVKKAAEEDKKAKDKELKREEELQKKKQELAEAGFTALRELAKKESEARIGAIDDELAKNEERQKRLESLADNQVQNAEENSALLQARQAELERERQKQVQRQQLVELGLATLETYSAKVAAGDENPFFSTVSDITLLRSFINALPAFYGGSERVGDDLSPVVSGKDGHVIRVDGGERILPTMYNQLIPNNMSNFELAQMAANANNTQGTQQDAAMLNRLERIENAINSQPVNVGTQYDELTKMITDIWKRKGKLERNIINKKRGLLG